MIKATKYLGLTLFDLWTPYYIYSSLNLLVTFNRDKNKIIITKKRPNSNSNNIGVLAKTEEEEEVSLNQTRSQFKSVL